MKHIFLFLFCVYASAQNGADRPSLGRMLDGNGSVRPVYGIAASVTLGDPDASGVLASACSKKFCLMKTHSSIISTTGAVDAPPGPALFAFDGDSAFVWFRESRQLMRWQEGVLNAVDVTVDGEVLSLRARNGSVEFAVRRHSGTWIVTADSNAIDSLPDAKGPVMLVDDGAVYSTGDALMIREIALPLANAEFISSMGEGYVQVRAREVNYAVRIARGRETFFQLPGAN